MKISILCSSRSHPAYPWLEKWCNSRQQHDDIELVETSAALKGGDLLFLVSCNEMIPRLLRQRYRATLVLHASDLPKGRGWSPHIWQILDGKRRILVTLLEAGDQVDSGDIWAQEWMEFEGHELYEEINAKLFATELRLMERAVEQFETIRPQPQGSGPATYYRKRTPADSQLDPEKSLAEQFDLLRVSDPQRYPAYFDYRGHRYVLHIEKAMGDSNG